MAEAVDTVTSDSAEKAYAAAAESAVAKADAEASPAALAFPAKPVRVSAKAETPKAFVEAAPATAPELVMPVKKSKPVPVAAKKVAAAKSAKKIAPKIKPALTTLSKIKEPKMATKKTTDFTATVKTAAAKVQAKAKLALAKGSEVYGEASKFTKGNVEAAVTSGKILGTGLQDLGKTYVAEGKTAYETVTSDVKELAAVKSPADFFQVQTAILRRNFDHAFAFGGKNSETVLKLASEAFAPIAARGSLAVAMVKKAA
jgi:hypothetical protein